MDCSFRPFTNIVGVEATPALAPSSMSLARSPLVDAESMQELRKAGSRPTEAPILKTSSRVARSHRWLKTLSWYSQKRPFSWAQMPPSDSSHDPG